MFYSLSADAAFHLHVFVPSYYFLYVNVAGLLLFVTWLWKCRGIIICYKNPCLL